MLSRGGAAAASFVIISHCCLRTTIRKVMLIIVMMIHVDEWRRENGNGYSKWAGNGSRIFSSESWEEQDFILEGQA